MIRRIQMLMRSIYILALICFVSCLGGVGELLAESKDRAPEFRVPAGLRDRVNFWIDIFAKHGKYQSVIHHRNYPQAVFAVLDFSAEGEVLSPVRFAKEKERRVKEATERVKIALLRLAGGNQPSSALEREVKAAMEKVPGGPGKYSEAVKEDLIRSQTGIRERYAEAVQRSGRYLPIMERIFQQEFGLPKELTRLPFIESSFDYTAYSSVGAAGIWQFMRTTGRAYLTINSYVDERRDPIEATRAAAKYLRSAYQRLGTWPLALTSYNHGVAGVAKKVRQLGTNNIVEIVERPRERLFGFASGNFYPEFLAALDIYEEHLRYFPEVRIEPSLQIAQMKLPNAISIHRVVQNTGVPAEELKRYNYAVSDNVWRGRYPLPKGYTLKVPKAAGLKMASLAQPSLAEPEVPAASSIYGGVVYKVRAGDTVGSIARKYNTSVGEIVRLNGLKNFRIRVGQILKVRQSEQQQVSDPTSSSVVKSKPTPKAGTKSSRTHKVRSGESLWTISRKYSVSLAALKAANPTMGAKIKPGQTLRVP